MQANVQRPTSAASAAKLATGSNSSSDIVYPPFVIPLNPAHCVYTSQYCEENAYKLAQQLLKRLPAAADAAASSSSSSSSSASTSLPATLSTPLPDLESIYPQLADENIFVVFMSNTFKQLLLFKQKIGDTQHDNMVVWDYLKPSSGLISKMCTCGRGPSSPVAAGGSSEEDSDAPVWKGVEKGSCPCAAYVYDFDTTLPFITSLRSYAEGSFRAHLVQPKSKKAKRLFRVCGAKQFLKQFASDRSHMLAPVQLLASVLTNKAKEMKSANEAKENQQKKQKDSAFVDVEEYKQPPAAAGTDHESFAQTHATRREIEEERHLRAQVDQSWESPSIQRKLEASQSREVSRVRSSVTRNGDDDDDEADAEWMERAVKATYLAPPPVYAPIRAATGERMNLDLYRFFTYPDSNRGVVMNQDEFLQFCHVDINAQ